MAKISSDRRGKGAGCVKSLEEMAAEDRIKPSMSLDDIVAVLAEHRVKTWHMRSGTSHVLIFRGDDAPTIMGQIYEFVFGKK